MSVFVPPGKQTFVDPATGDVLSFGTVEHYVPGGSTPKDTWSDEAQTALNENPIVLDAEGQCVIWGEGLYRQIARREDGTQLWDQVTGFQPADVPVDPTGNVWLCSFLYEGDDPPPADCLLGGWVAPADASFAANLSGSQFFIDTDYLPTAEYVISAQVDDVEVGTITVGVDGAYVLATASGVPFTIDTGHRLTLRGPGTADDTANQFFGTLVGAFV